LQEHFYQGDSGCCYHDILSS